MLLNHELESRGFSNLRWTSNFEPNYWFTSINANADVAAREPSQMVAMLHALLRGRQFTIANPGEERQQYPRRNSQECGYYFVNAGYAST